MVERNGVESKVKRKTNNNNNNESDRLYIGWCMVHKNSCFYSSRFAIIFLNASRVLRAAAATVVVAVVIIVIVITVVVVVVSI